MIYVYEITGIPTAWASHGGYGNKSFNPHYKKKKHAQWQLKIQHKGRPRFTRTVCADFFFEMPIPKSMEKKILARIHSGQKVFCPKRPDATNLRKFAEDCIVGPVLFDDNIVVAGETQKYYTAEKPRTLIMIQEIFDDGGRFRDKITANDRMER